VARAKRTDPAAPPPDDADDQAATPLAERLSDESVPADHTLPDVEVMLAEPSPAAQAPEPVSDPPPPPAVHQTIVRRGGFVPLVLGGIVAAGIGAGGAFYAAERGVIGPLTEAPDLTALTERLDALAAATDTAMRKADDTAAAVAALPAPAAVTDPSPAIAAAQTRLDAVGTAVGALATRLDAIDARLSTLEKRPVTGGTGASAEAITAFQREMDEMRALVESQRAAVTASQEEIAAAAAEAAARIKTAEDEAARLRAETETAARTARARAALSHLRAALESGVSIEGALADLAQAGIDVPPALADQAMGVPSLAALRQTFPEVARDALTLSLRDTAGDGTFARIGAFLRSQSGARSLTPRAGDDPDAVLSRAEAALAAGDLGGAITELGGLPDSGRTRFVEWIALAERRIAAVDAVAALSAGLN
jgi:hypothetical protein